MHTHPEIAIIGGTIWGNRGAEAMLVTTIVLSIGFFIFGFAAMKNVRNFGLLTGFAIIMALLSDYLIAPALMVLVSKKKSSTVEESNGRKI